jgi:hypothetical protein
LAKPQVTATVVETLSGSESAADDARHTEPHVQQDQLLFQQLRSHTSGSWFITFPLFETREQTRTETRGGRFPSACSTAA